MQSRFQRVRGGHGPPSYFLFKHHMKKAASKLFICGLGSTATVICLYIFSGMLTHSKNGFIRLFPSHFIVDSNRLDIGYNSYYIAGITDTHIYLGNYTATNQVMQVNYALNDIHRIILSVPSGRRFAWKAMKVFVDSTGIYMMEGISPIILHVDFHNRVESEYRSFKPFNESIPISPGSFIMNRFDAPLNQDILVKLRMDTTNHQMANYILSKQMDGIFSVDGMINWDPDNKKIVYLYFYRNEFICLDTNLTPIYTGHTIDTIRHAHIKLTPPSPERTITFASPPLMTNQRCCVSGNWLYIQSALMANNEKPEYFKTNSVIDLYSIQNGRYRFSFYLPDLFHSKARDFCVRGNRLFALYGHYLVSFKMYP